MKIKSIAILAIAALLCMLSGCATNAPKPLPPAQIVAIACPPVQAAIVQFEAINATLANQPAAVKANAALKQIQPVVTAACAVGAKVSVANVQEFAQTVLPALSQVAVALPVPPAQLTQIQAGLVAAQVAISTVAVIQQQVQAAQPAEAVSTK